MAYSGILSEVLPSYRAFFARSSGVVTPAVALTVLPSARVIDNGVSGGGTDRFRRRSSKVRRRPDTLAEGCS